MYKLRLISAQVHGDDVLGAALASNKTLGALSLWGNERISAAASAQLRAAWQRNGLLSLDDD